MRHADDAGRDELEVAALAGLLKHRPQAEAQGEQVHQRLAQRERGSAAGSAGTSSPRAARGCRMAATVLYCAFAVFADRYLLHIRATWRMGRCRRPARRG